MHLCAVAAPPESILRLRVEFVWSIFPNSWRILSPPSQRESTLQRSNCVSLHFMVKRIPGKNGQKRLIKLHLLHLTIEFPIFPIFKSKCIFKGLKSENFFSAAKKGFSTFEVKMSLEKRVFILAAFVKSWGRQFVLRLHCCLRLFYTTFTCLSSSLKIPSTTVLGQFCLHSCGLKWLSQLFVFSHFSLTIFSRCQLAQG